jgi:hypothetical protein
MTRSGTAFVLPTSAHPTDDSASSSLLPTPNTVDQSGSTPGSLRAEQGHQVDLRSAVIDLLQTPQAHDAKGSPSPAHRNGGLTRQVERELLPTPIAADSSSSGKDAPNRTGGPKLSTVVMTGDALLPTTRAVQGETRNHTIYERPGSPVNNLETALAPLLPTPMAMIEESKSPEHRKGYGHGSYFSDLPHLLGLEGDAGAEPARDTPSGPLPTPTAEQCPSPSRSSRRARQESTSASTPDLFSDGS